MLTARDLKKARPGQRVVRLHPDMRRALWDRQSTFERLAAGSPFPEATLRRLADGELIKLSVRMEMALFQLAVQIEYRGDLWCPPVCPVHDQEDEWVAA